MASGLPQVAALHPPTPGNSLGVRWGVWGEGGKAPDSPQGYTAKIHFRKRGPSRAPVAQEAGAPLCGGPQPSAGYFL